MGFVAERGDVAGNRFSGIDHHSRTHGLELPVEQVGVKFLSFFTVAASDFKVNDWISHVSPSPYRILFDAFVLPRR
jgi:hypothetical protein